MPRVVFMCGPAGAGKSTTASQFERSGMVRLSFDQEAWSRGYRSMPLPDHSHRDIETHLRRRLIDLVGTGHDVRCSSVFVRFERLDQTTSGSSGLF